ncbi:MAG: viroplasmin family protein [Chitinophagales bacterium]
MAKHSKFYVVWRGHQTGVFTDWESCKKSVEAFKNPAFKSFKTEAEAIVASRGRAEDFLETNSKDEPIVSKDNIIINSICVDAACSGNPGPMEYRGVDYETKKQLFLSKVYQQGTNNIGEFIAIIHAIGWMQTQKVNKIIYTDSKTAISWIRNKKIKTNLKQTEANKELFEVMNRALQFVLKNDMSQYQILKWETESWGEIPADFGRK